MPAEADVAVDVLRQLLARSAGAHGAVATFSEKRVGIFTTKSQRASVSSDSPSRSPPRM